MQVDYCKLCDELGFENLYSEKSDGVILARVDINSPVNQKTGKISMDIPNLRNVYTAPVLEKCAEIAPTVVIAHNGNPGDKDFVKFNNHASLLDTLMLKSTVHYEEVMDPDDYFNARLLKRIKDLEQGDILLIENIRHWGIETGYKADHDDRPRFNDFFRKAGVTACLNEGGPMLHRKHWSTMDQPDIAPTYIGPITAQEIRTNQMLDEDSEKKALITGGAKPKVSHIYDIMERGGWDSYLVGLSAQYFLRSNGADLGEKNNEFVDAKLASRFKESDIEMMRKLDDKYDIYTPCSFMVMDGVSVEEVDLADLPKHDRGIIVDIGDHCVGELADRINSEGYAYKVNAGSAGVYELDQNNGSELIWRIADNKTLVLGGDTIESLQRSGYCRPIESLRTMIELMGGSAIHRWAGNLYQPLEKLHDCQSKG